MNPVKAAFPAYLRVLSLACRVDIGTAMRFDRVLESGTVSNVRVIAGLVGLGWLSNPSSFQFGLLSTSHALVTRVAVSNQSGAAPLPTVHESLTQAKVRDMPMIQAIRQVETSSRHPWTLAVRRCTAGDSRTLGLFQPSRT